MRIIKKIAVGFVKSFGFVSSMITVVLIILIAGAYYADSRFAGGYYSGYFIQNGIGVGNGLFFNFSRFTETHPILSIVLIAVFFSAVISLKIVMRVVMIKKARRYFLTANISYLAVNVILNMLLIFANAVIAFNGMIVTYIYSVTDGGEKAGAEFAEQIDFVKEQVEQNKNLSFAALQKIIFDAEKSPDYFSALAENERAELCGEINRLIDLRGGPQSREEHYFRNRLNYAPPTLADMEEEIKSSGRPSWVLLPPEQSAYHMFGPEGEYNLKFVSADGFFEAVYNKAGVLLTEQNDAVNMGTYNYADPVTEPQKHSVYDVLPYYDWGNTPDSFSALDDELLEDDIELVLNALEKFEANGEARERYLHYKDLFDNIF